jgi:hypothetical protein
MEVYCRSYYDTASRIDKLPAVGVMDMLRYHTYLQVQVGHTIMEQHKIVKKCLNTLKAISVHNVKVELTIQLLW